MHWIAWIVSVSGSVLGLALQVSAATAPSYPVRPLRLIVPAGPGGGTAPCWYLRSGKLRGLGVSTPRRSSTAPDVPAIAETYPGYEAVQWYGLLAPAGTPRVVLARIHDAASAALALPDVAKLLSDQGAEVVSGSRSEFAAFIAREKQGWAEVVTRAGISAP